MQPLAISSSKGQRHVSCHQVHDVHRLLQLGSRDGLAEQVMDGSILARVVEAVLGKILQIQLQMRKIYKHTKGVH